jgi:hypothetical protein
MSCAASNALNHSAGLFGRARIEDRRLRAHLDQRRRHALRDRFVLQPSCSGTMANVLGREPSVGRCVVSCSRRTMMRIRLSITRGWRAIRESNPSRLMRSSSVSRSATSCAECGSPEISDISPTVSPACHMGDETPRAIVVFHEHAEAAGDDEKQRMIVLAVALEKRAARQAEPIRFGKKPLERGLAHFVQQRKIAQTRAQRVRIDGLATDAKGGQKCHVHRLPAAL